MKRFDIIMSGPGSFTNTYHDGGMFVHASEACAKIARLEAEVADNYSSAADRITELMAECAALRAENEALSEKLKRKDFQINDLKTTAAKRRKQIKDLKKKPVAMRAGERP